MLHRLPEQGGEADQRILRLLLHQRQLPLLGGDQAFLLRQFQRCRRAGIKARLHQFQHALRVSQIQFGNAALLTQRQGLRISIGNAAEQRQLNRRAIKFAGLQRKLRTVARRSFTAPEIDLIRRAQIGIEIVHGFIAAVGIQLAITLAAQQFLPIGIQPGLDLRQQRAASNHRAGLRLLNARHRSGKVETADASLFDQTIQLRAAKLCPPLRVVAGDAGAVR